MQQSPWPFADYKEEGYLWITLAKGAVKHGNRIAQNEVEQQIMGADYCREWEKRA